MLAMEKHKNLTQKSQQTKNQNMHTQHVLTTTKSLYSHHFTIRQIRDNSWDIAEHVQGIL